MSIFTLAPDPLPPVEPPILPIFPSSDPLYRYRPDPLACFSPDRRLFGGNPHHPPRQGMMVLLLPLFALLWLKNSIRFLAVHTLLLVAPCPICHLSEEHMGKC